MKFILSLLILFTLNQSQAKIPRLLIQYQKFVSMSICTFRITSYIRSKAHNRRVGGVKKSFHLNGQALDVVAEKGCEESYKQLGILAKRYFNGVIVYKTHLHLDLGDRIYYKL